MKIKKSLLLLVFLLFMVSLSAQTEKKAKEETKTEKLSDYVPQIEQAIEDTTDIFIIDMIPEIANDDFDAVLQDSLVFMTEQVFEAQNSGEAFMDLEMVKMLDSLYNINYFEGVFLLDSTRLNVYGYPSNEVPVFHDTIYAQRIEKLNRETTIPLTFNTHVKSFIDLYASNKRELTSRMLGLSYVYFPMFEEVLDKYNMPLELKYLAVVESALNPTAGSRMGAKGLWQFMYTTGKVYKLKVTSLVDDRFDPLKSTEAACQHMLDLYNIYNDWFLVLAAYNSGAGNVNKAIRRAGGIKEYWAIWPFLPKETRGYVPAFIAVNYVMNYSSEHNIYPIHPGKMMHGTDTVAVNELLSFDQINEKLGVPIDDIKFFNPQYIKGIIPASSENPCFLRLPLEYVGAYVENEKELYAFKTKKGIELEKLQEEVKKVSDRSLHIVKSGENLGVIARKYNVSVNQLKAWNGMKKNTIYPRQKLIVYTSGAPMAQAGEKPVMRSTTSSTHTVTSGESLSSIARKYKCSVTDLREWNSLKNNTIHPKQKLRVYPPATETAQSGKTGTTIYTVKSGDTLWDIARKFDGVTVDQIKKWNNLNSKSTIKPGQKLKIAPTS
ncbi:MAG: LysM peptidoglycan-binding domain-containing protein [Lentimicrobiaceae bacterium]|nr:LysM peptidoglycan-binding domain-containing protein [Lentimicrobiaceae bacterium]